MVGFKLANVWLDGLKCREYYDNIRVVDEGIKKMEQLIEAYFNNDGQTAYVMTADHGMTDWGASVKVLLNMKLLYSSNMPLLC